MNKHTLKKLLGTSLLIIITGVIALTATGHAQALFDFTGNRLNVSGNVTTVGSSNFVLDVSGRSTITVDVNRDTDFRGGYRRLRDVHVGDTVRVRSTRRNRNAPANRITAELVRKLDNVSSYGTDCDKFRVQDGTYQASGIANTFYVVKGNIKVLVHYDENTRIRGGTLESIRPNEKVEINVRGDDCRQTDSLYADRIVLIDRNNDEEHGAEEHGDKEGHHSHDGRDD